MSDLTERVADAICEERALADDDMASDHDLARAAIREVLAAMREPSEAVVSAVTDVSFDYPVGDRNSQISLYSREQVVAILAAAAESLARENGIEP